MDLRKEQKKTESLSICSVNICGLSERSRFALDQYVSTKGLDIVAVQEAGRVKKDTINLAHMNPFCDSNQGANKGCVLYVHEDLRFIPLPSIAAVSKQIDSVWGLVVIGSKRIIVGTVYVKLSYNQAINEVLEMLERADKEAQRLSANGVILAGDYNARHTNWGDTTVNTYGKQLAAGIDYHRFDLVGPSSPTFVSANGHSLIDLFITTNSIVDNVSYCKTDDQACLFTGAPFRGHLPASCNNEHQIKL